MAYLGRRVEVFWPPEGDETEGTWYVGELDRYDRTGAGGDGGGGGGGYHVAYDDGDEEVLGEVDGRADVHLLGEDVSRSEDAFEVGHAAPPGPSPHDAAPRQGRDLCTSPMEIPRAETLGHSSDDDNDNEHQNSPLGESPAGYPGGETLAGRYKVHHTATENPCAKEIRDRDRDALKETSESQDYPLDLAGIGSGRRGGRGGSGSDNQRGVTPPKGNASADGSFSLDQVERPTSPHNVTGSYSEGGYHSEEEEEAGGGGSGDRFGGGSGDPERSEGGSSGDRSGGGSVEDDGRNKNGDGFAFDRSGNGNNSNNRGVDDLTLRSRRGEKDFMSCSSDSASCSHTDSDGGSLSPSADEDGIFGLGGDLGRREGGLSLSANSSEWTPLLGPDLLGLPREERRGEWFAGSADEQVAASEENVATEGMISALRNAVDASVVGAMHESRGPSDMPPGSWQGRTDRHLGGGGGVGGGGVGGVGVGNGRGGGGVGGGGASGSAGNVKGEELKALGGLVQDTALLEGAVEGVEGRGAEDIEGLDGGVFVKVSFIDGGGRDAQFSTTNAMFRCKTLLHTTGLKHLASDGSEWPRGQFQCETFHGGRLGELANAAVLFSVHRRANAARGSGRGGGGGDDLKGRAEREGFLGQVIISLQTLVLNMRPIVEPTRPTTTAGRQTENLARAKPGGNGESGASSQASWRSMRSELSGAFPAADRCGRVSSEDAGRLCLRLILSLSLPLKPPTRRAGSAAEAQQQRTTAEARRKIRAGAAPYATIVSTGRGLTRQRRPHRGDRASNYGRGRGSGGGAKHSSENPPQSTSNRRRTGSNKTPSSAAKPRVARNPPLPIPAPGLRQRQKRQEEIFRENVRMERRLKVIREAAPRKEVRREVAHKAPRYRAGGNPPRPLPEHEQRRRGRRWRDDGGLQPQPQLQPRDDARAQAKGGPTGSDREPPLRVTEHHAHGIGCGCTADIGRAQGKGKEETGWREVYNKRQALALAVETAAAELAGVRARVEALRAKTRWTEANARSATLAVASLQKSFQGSRGHGRLGGKNAAAAPPYSSGRAAERAAATGWTSAGAGGAQPGSVFAPLEICVEDDGVERELATELRRQEELNEALVERRRKVVVAGETARLAREADLKALDGVRAQLKDAEDRQGRYRWRQQEKTARKYSPHPATTTSTAVPMVRDATGDDFVLPKDSFESAQELALSLRVEVETLRLAEAMEGQNKGAESWAMREAQEEVAKLQERLESKRRRLEAACFDRDAIRAEYQHWMNNGRRSALKESIAWLEHASLQLSKS